MLALSLTGWTGYARLARAQVLTLRERDYVQAARALGASDARILWYHLLPNAAGPLLIQATSALPGTLLAESSLSFLGLGAPPGTPSWGRWWIRAPSTSSWRPMSRSFPDSPWRSRCSAFTCSATRCAIG
ncbi:ABC transporter permease [Cystobacter fuscus]